MKSFVSSAQRLKFSIKCVLQDALQNYRYMDNWHRSGRDYWKLSSELLFFYHKLEKGLALPSQKKCFGLDPAKRTLSLVREWKDDGFSEGDPIFSGALKTLHAYSQSVPVDAPLEYSQLSGDIREFLTQFSYDQSDLTPVLLNQLVSASEEVFEQLVRVRRSVRNFKDRDVDRSLIEASVRSAQLAPSACNRQPCKVHFFEKGELQQKILSYQNGNRGFGHTIPLLAVVTAESKTFFDFSERNEPYLDAGLFLSYFLLSLQSKGVSTCCLNWCASPWHDRMVRQVLPVEDSEKIITFLGIGYAEDNCVVPKSPRRDVSSVAIFHDVKSR